MAFSSLSYMFDIIKKFLYDSINKMDNTIGSNDISNFYSCSFSCTINIGHHLDNISSEHLGGDHVLISSARSIVNVPTYSLFEQSPRQHMSQQYFLDCLMIMIMFMIKKTIHNIFWNLCKSFIGRGEHCERSCTCKSTS